MLEHVKIFWERTQDEEIEKLFPINGGTLNDAMKLYEESLRPGAESFGRVIYIDGKYIGDVWCYGIDETDEGQAFVSIVIFDKKYWGQGVGKRALTQFCRIVFDKYAISRLCAFTYKHNIKSKAMLKSVGFEKIEDFEEDGIPSCYYELLML